MKPLNNLLFIVILILLSGCSLDSENSGQKSPENQQSPTGDTRPNILLIVADDLGYGDLGVFGSEINTPNLDSLAGTGVILNQFYASPVCSTTRAMLMSGMDHHLTGLGNMAEEVIFVSNQRDKPGYEGHLNTRVASLAELLKDGGYRTYMTGKWHLGETRDSRPASRGFEKSFSLIDSGAGHFNMMRLAGPGKAKYQEDGKVVDKLPADFYSSRFYVERMIEYIDNGRAGSTPFFAYLAFTAPHWPLQAPQESIAKYHGQYDQGYDVLYAQRLSRMQELGLVSDDVQPFPRMLSEQDWDQLTASQKRIEARKMEIYAAMVDDLDRFTGQLLEYLKQSGQYENTFIFFLSDNGPEGHHLEKGWDALGKWVEECCDNRYENMGNANSYLWYGPNWARAGNIPHRMFKGFTTEGSVRVPAFVHYPKLSKQGVIHDGFVTVKDVMPTILELAGVTHPGAVYNGRKVLPMQGISMLSMLNGSVQDTHKPGYAMGWELFGRRAIRQDDWKIVWETDNEYFKPWPVGIETDRWQLFNLSEDSGELKDLSRQHPDKLEDMLILWKQYVQENGVILPDFTSGY